MWRVGCGQHFETDSDRTLWPGQSLSSFAVFSFKRIVYGSSCPGEKKLRHSDPHLQRQKNSDFRYFWVVRFTLCDLGLVGNPQHQPEFRYWELSEMCWDPENYPPAQNKPSRTKSKSDHRPAPMFPWNINTLHRVRRVTLSISRILALCIMWIPGKFPGCIATKRSFAWSRSWWGQGLAVQHTTPQHHLQPPGAFLVSSLLIALH